MKLFFFGVGPRDTAGHFLHDANSHKLWGSEADNALPFRYTILDGGLLPPGVAQTQGQIHHSIINGYTVISMPDFSADRRAGCNASFIADDMFTKGKMAEICAKQFPELWKRINPLLQ